jgi:hypothetical protein
MVVALMDLTPLSILKLFAIANMIPIVILLWFVIAPFVTTTASELTIGKIRYAWGSHGWVVQEAPAGKVLRRGWFPWGPPSVPNDIPGRADR